jgi:hypothetical protein
LTLRAGPVFFDAIASRQGNRLDSLSTYVDALYHLEKHEYNGNSSLQLNVRDIRPAGTLD